MASISRLVRPAVIATTLALTMAGAASQTPPQTGQTAGGQTRPQQPPVFRGGVNYVAVDVIVSGRDGQAITDLQQADFEVTEDGKPQKVDTFRFVEVKGTVKPGDPTPKAIRSEYDEEAEAAREDVRLFALFLDDYHVRRMSAMVVKSALTSFVQKQIGEMDLVGVMYPLTPVSAVLMSRNRDRLFESIQRFEGRKYDYTPRNRFEEQYAMYPAAIVERIRNQVTLSALESLVTHMGSLREGRKAVILVSEGFSNTLPAQLNDPVAGMPGLGNPARNYPGLESYDERSAFFGNVDLQQDLRRVYDAANRTNTAIYALDPRGLATNAFDINEGVGAQTDRQYLQSSLDTLRVLADQTDGRAIVNRNDLEAGLKQVVADSSAYYLLGYNSTRATADGKFHEIKVRVTRPGVQVRARRGYWALTREEMERSLAPRPPSAPPAVSKALGTISEPRRGRYIRTWLGTAKGADGKTRVTFVWEPLPNVPGVARTQPASLLVVASGSDGGQYFNGRVPEKDAAQTAATTTPEAGTGGGAATPAQPAGRGPARVTFDAAPGPLVIRYAVQGVKGETLDTDIREFKLPDLTGPTVAISTPWIFRAANAREFQALVAQPEPVPTPSREFRRVERILVRFEAYAPGSEVPVVTSRVLNRGGTGMATLTVSPPEKPGQPYQLDLPLAGFAPGEYLIEIKAKAQSGEVTELIPLKVTS